MHVDAFEIMYMPLASLDRVPGWKGGIILVIMLYPIAEENQDDSDFFGFPYVFDIVCKTLICFRMSFKVRWDGPKMRETQQVCSDEEDDPALFTGSTPVCLVVPRRCYIYLKGIIWSLWRDCQFQVLRHVYYMLYIYICMCIYTSFIYVFSISVLQCVHLWLGDFAIFGWRFEIYVNKWSTSPLFERV